MMKQNEMAQAERLFFQTNLSKSEIAEFLGVTRRTVHNWVNDNDWGRLKKSGEHMPAFLAENCYFVMAKLQYQILSETSAEKPINISQVNMLSKMASTIKRLNDSNSLNETIQMCAHLLDHIHEQNPVIAKVLQPHIDSYIKTKVKTASGELIKLMSSHHNNIKAQSPAEGEHRTRQQLIDEEEARLDEEDMLYWAQNPPSEEVDDKSSDPGTAPIQTESKRPLSQTQTNRTTPTNQHNNLNLSRAQRRELERKQKKNKAMCA